MDNTNNEASFVAFTAIEKDGYTWNVTVRKGMTKSDIEGMFTLIEAVQKKAKDEGYIYKAPVRGGAFPKKEPVVVGKCPTCGADLIEGVTKNGKKFHKCSTNKWNPATKQAEGCAYILWLDK